MGGGATQRGCSEVITCELSRNKRWMNGYMNGKTLVQNFPGLGINWNSGPRTRRTPHVEGTRKCSL